MHARLKTSGWVRRIGYFIMVVVAVLGLFHAAMAQEPVLSAEQLLQDAEVKASSEGLGLHVAPGETLPVSVELLNFGGGRRVDVSIIYEIFDDHGFRLLREDETVAVETTASFVKKLPISLNTPPGEYVMMTSIFYPGQVVPATSRFGFTVEKKVFGLFRSQFLPYGGAVLILLLLSVFGGRYLLHRIQRSRIKPYDYSQVPKKNRLYYELVSDVIMQMRLRVGDDAIRMAKTINELEIDDKGKVLVITENPAKIMALLVLQYEKNFGKHVELHSREKTDTENLPENTENMKRVRKNIDVVRKYFQ